MVLLKHKIGHVIKEEFILTYALIKWLIMAVLSGALVGAMTAFFIDNLEFAIDFVKNLPVHSVYLLLPLGIIVTTLSIRYFAPEARGHGTEKVIEAIHKRAGRIDIKVIPIKLVTTIITLAVGGSAGKEGPAAQIGAGLTSSLADFMGFNETDRKKLVICGISAGFSAVFGTPIAGAVFGLEVLYIGKMYYDVMLPSFISGVVSYHVAENLGMTYYSLPETIIPSLSAPSFMWLIIAGVFFGMISFMHIEILRFFEFLFNRMKAGLVFKALVGSVTILGLTLFLGNRYLGLGGETIDAALTGNAVPFWSFFWKSIFTSITLSCGGSGGIVTPVFFIGATSGITFASIFGLNPLLYGPLGFVSVLSGCANTPIAATIMAIELFGGKIAAMAAISCITSFFVCGHRSVYPSQVLARPKSPVIELTGEDPVECSSSRPNLIGLRFFQIIRDFPEIVQRLKNEWEGKKKT